jgi:hypothetical protein
MWKGWASRRWVDERWTREQTALHSDGVLKRLDPRRDWSGTKWCTLRSCAESKRVVLSKCHGFLGALCMRWQSIFFYHVERLGRDSLLFLNVIRIKQEKDSFKDLFDNETLHSIQTCRVHLLPWAVGSPKVLVVRRVADMACSHFYRITEIQGESAACYFSSTCVSFLISIRMPAMLEI